MNIYDLTVNQLKRAVAIREQIDALNKQLRRILDGSGNSTIASSNSHGMSASVRRKIAATQRARWAKLRRANSKRSAKPAKTTVKKATNASANARRSAKLKAYWAAKKKSAKK
jgi:hypothetical protein